MASSERADDRPVLSLSIYQSEDRDKEFQLNRQSFTGFTLIEVTTFETERTVTFVCSSLVVRKYRHINLLEALKSGLFELVEAGKEDVIKIPSTEPCPIGRMEVPPKPSPQHGQISAGMQTDSRDEVWKEILQAGKTYELRLSKSGGEAWAYYTDDEHSETSLEAIPEAQKLPVARDTSNTVRFTVYDYPAAPNLFAKLILSEECHVSGTPPFTLVIELSTDSDKTITIDKSHTPLTSFGLDLHSVEELIECKDTETGDEVDWPASFGCFDEDPRPKFPDDDDFVEVGPNQVWRFEHTINNADNGDGTVSGLGGLEELVAGRTYKAQVATKYITGFSRWMFGKKEDLLKGDLEEKQQRWIKDDTKTGYLEVDVRGEPVVFKAVD
jgi:hypothetical protein